MKLVFQEFASRYVIVTHEGRAVVTVPIVSGNKETVIDNTCSANAVTRDNLVQVPRVDGTQTSAPRIVQELERYAQALRADINLIEQSVAEVASTDLERQANREAIEELEDIKRHKVQRLEDVSWYLRPGYNQHGSALNTIAHTLGQTDIFGFPEIYKAILPLQPRSPEHYNIRVARLRPRLPDPNYAFGNPGDRFNFSEQFADRIRRLLMVIPEPYPRPHASYGNPTPPLGLTELGTLIQGKEEEYSPACNVSANSNNEQGVAAQTGNRVDFDTGIAVVEQRLGQTFDLTRPTPENPSTILKPETDNGSGDLVHSLEEANNNFNALLEEIHNAILAAFWPDQEAAGREAFSYAEFRASIRDFLKARLEDLSRQMGGDIQARDYLSTLGYDAVGNYFPPPQIPGENPSEDHQIPGLNPRDPELNICTFLAGTVMDLSDSVEKYDVWDLVKQPLRESLLRAHPLFDYLLATRQYGDTPYFAQPERHNQAVVEMGRRFEMLPMAIQTFLLLMAANIEFEDAVNQQPLIPLIESYAHSHEFFRLLQDRAAIEAIHEGGFFKYLYDGVLQIAENAGLRVNQFRQTPYETFYQYFITRFTAAAGHKHLDENIIFPANHREGMFCIRRFLCVPAAALLHKDQQNPAPYHLRADLEEQINRQSRYIGSLNDSVLPFEYSHPSARKSVEVNIDMIALYQAAIDSPSASVERRQLFTHLARKKEVEAGVYTYGFQETNFTSVIANSEGWRTQLQDEFTAFIRALPENTQEREETELNYVMTITQQENNTEFSIDENTFNLLKQYAVVQGVRIEDVPEAFDADAVQHVLTLLGVNAQLTSPVTPSEEGTPVEASHSSQQEPVLISAQDGNAQALAHILLSSRNVSTLTLSDLNRLYKYAAHWYPNADLGSPKSFMRDLGAGLIKIISALGLPLPQEELEALAVQKVPQDDGDEYLVLMPTRAILQLMTPVLHEPSPSQLAPSRQGYSLSEVEDSAHGQLDRAMAVLSAQQAPEQMTEFLRAARQADDFNYGSTFDGYNPRFGLGLGVCPAFVLENLLPPDGGVGPELNILTLGHNREAYRLGVARVLRSAMMHHAVLALPTSARGQLRGSLEANLLSELNPFISELREQAMNGDTLPTDLLSIILEPHTLADLIGSRFYTNGTIDAYNLCTRGGELANRVISQITSARHRLPLLLQQIQETNTRADLTLASFPALDFSRKPEGQPFTAKMLKLAESVYTTGMVAAAKAAAFKAQGAGLIRDGANRYHPLIIPIGAYNVPDEIIIKALSAVRRSLRGMPEVRIYILADELKSQLLFDNAGPTDRKLMQLGAPRPVSVDDFLALGSALGDMPPAAIEPLNLEDEFFSAADEEPAAQSHLDFDAQWFTPQRQTSTRRRTTAWEPELALPGVASGMANPQPVCVLEVSGEAPDELRINNPAARKEIRKMRDYLHAKGIRPEQGIRIVEDDIFLRVRRAEDGSALSVVVGAELRGALKHAKLVLQKGLRSGLGPLSEPATLELGASNTAEQSMLILNPALLRPTAERDVTQRVDIPVQMPEQSPETSERQFRAAYKA